MGRLRSRRAGEGRQRLTPANLNAVESRGRTVLNRIRESHNLTGSGNLDPSYGYCVMFLGLVLPSKPSVWSRLCQGRQLIGS
jgi:hypothetical protein